MSADLLRAALTAIALSIVLAAFYRFLPLGGRRADPALAELESRFGKWERRGVLLWLGLVAPLAAGFWGLCVWVARPAQPAGDVYLVSEPSAVLYAVLSFFLALPASAILTEAALKAKLGDELEAFMRFQEIKWGFRGDRLGRVVYAVFGLACLSLIVAILDWRVVFERDRMRVDPFFVAKERALKYEDIVAIRTAPRFVAPIGNRVEERVYAVEFADGEVWTTRDLPQGLNDERKRELARFLSERSGAPIEEFEVLERDRLKSKRRRSPSIPSPLTSRAANVNLARSVFARPAFAPPRISPDRSR
jgi:hypothetical protein